MKENIQELLFLTRLDFRLWLSDNAQISEGVWLIFSKTKFFITLSANEALEEALCFGWIDGQIKSIDETKYLKYFTKRRINSSWSEKNRNIVEELRKKGLMTTLGEQAIEIAKSKGLWNLPKSEPITEEQVNVFCNKLIGLSPAFENFNKMSPSVKRVYTARYLANKSEESRQRDFIKIVDRLNNNLKPM